MCARVPHISLLLVPIVFAVGVSGCGTFGWGVRPEPVAPAAAVEALASASAVISMANVSGVLALESVSPAATTRVVRLSHGEEEGRGGPARAVRTVVTNPDTPTSPSRTLLVRGETRETASSSPGTERWAMPVNDPRITSHFGPRIDPITGERGRMHRGTDFGAPSGTPVHATASGEVVLAGWCDRGTGNCVVIDHAGGWRSQYFHMSSVSVRAGSTVAQGERIGAVGSTGRSTGPHLHFQVGREGEATDAEPLFGEPLFGEPVR